MLIYLVVDLVSGNELSYHVHLLLVESGEEEDEVLADVELDHGGVARVFVEHPDRSVRGLELVDPQEAEEELERI